MNSKAIKVFMSGIASLALSALLHATITVNSPHSISPYYTPGGSNSIASYDWDSNGDLFYQTSTPIYYYLGGFYKHEFSTSTTTTLTLSGGTYADYAGASVLTIGDFVYFNSSDTNNVQAIYKYSSGSSVTLESTDANYGLYTYDGDLFVTGAIGWGTNHVYFHTVNGTTGALGTREDLGVTSGASGPLAFDADGNLYYAPGYGDPSIYKWSAAEVADAIADPVNDPLDIAGHLWHDYSADYGIYSGGTSMVVDLDGNLLLTITDFINPSILVRFEVNPITGNYANNFDEILEDTGRLGEIRLYNGDLYISSDNTIYLLTL
ncbi:hypothetical protein [Geminisphaera colitermitum]|uniref:hypothetical protein n=1 Tax=Geminisphaera colitermitum TaxID=1148786 RepID=UPI000158CF17|nr:hypothetical protein [Geminisphaera colitermitum]